MDNGSPFLGLAISLVLVTWIAMKMWLGLLVAVRWLRLPPERPAFMRWIEQALELEEVGDSPRLDMVAAAIFVLGGLNVLALVVLWKILREAGFSQPENLVVLVLFFAIQAGWVFWLARYAARHHTPE